MTLVYDYANGFVVDDETGLVVGRIYVVRGPKAVGYEEWFERSHTGVFPWRPFAARDEVAAQLSDLELSPTARRSAAALRRGSSGSRRREAELMGAYSVCLNVLSRYRRVTRREASIVASVVRAVADASGGTRLERLVIAALVVARYLLGVPVDVRGVARELGAGERDLVEAYRAVQRVFPRFVRDLRRVAAALAAAAADAVGAPQLLPLASLIVSRARSVHRPAPVAAAAVYLAAMLTGMDRWAVRQRDVAAALGISEPTLRSWVRRLAAELGLEISVKPGFSDVVSAPAQLCRAAEALGARVRDGIRCRVGRGVHQEGR